MPDVGFKRDVVDSPGLLSARDLAPKLRLAGDLFLLYHYRINLSSHEIPSSGLVPEATFVNRTFQLCQLPRLHSSCCPGSHPQPS